MRKYSIITLCGSTKFKDEFLRIQKELTLQFFGILGHSTDGDI